MHQSTILTLIIGTTFGTQISNIPTLDSLNITEEHIFSFVKEKCVLNGGGEEAFEVLKAQPFELNTCLQKHINYTQIQEELEESKKTGSMDEVFMKYCEKYPQMYTCVEAVNTNLAPCLNYHEQYSINKSLDFLVIVKEFMCSKDGDNLAMFVVKGGVECMQSNFQDLQLCFDNGVSMADLALMSTLPKFAVTEKECDDLHQVRVCFFEILGKCQENTPSNVVEAFFKFLKTEFACNDTWTEYSTKDWDNGDNLLRLVMVGVGLIVAAIIIYELLTTRVSIRRF